VAVPRVKGRIAEEYLREHPGMPKQTAAKWLREKYPEVFPTLNAARKAIQNITGNNGETNRGQAVPDLKTEPGTPGDPRPKIPKGWRGHKWRPHVVKARRTLALYDLHVPFHDPRAVDVAVNYGIDRGCDHLFIGGDLCDCYSISSYTKDPRFRKGLSWELTQAREMLSQIAPHFAQRTMVPGNHEDRLPRLVSDKTPELWDLAHIGWHALLDLEKFGVTWVGDHRAVKIGKLYLLHGHEIRKAGGVNPARTLFRKIKDTAMCGHFHRTAEHSEPILKLRDRTTVDCWTVGCLMRLEGVDYDLYHDYNHGLAIIHTDADGSFSVENRKIRMGRVE